MPECIIAGIPVNFPYEPYDVQKAYMEKVITCLQDGTNGVLESPTGTGKTLSLLCSSMAWVSHRKNEIKNMIQKNSKMQTNPGAIDDLVTKPSNFNAIPKIIYASRTHSQLTQCMQELKKTSYNFMRAVVLGSRDQLCIHPDVSREQGNATKTQMCQLKIHSKTCSFHLRIESKKDHPDFRMPSILDIEDLVNVGQKLRMCTYFASKELIPEADIIFMPYNYILDPMARKANKIELNNSVIILDEAHNIEKICEEAASVMIRSSDIALAIDDTTHIMKAISSAETIDFSDEPKDFSLEDLALLKEMLLFFEKAVDEISVKHTTEGTTFPANFIFELLAKAKLNYSTAGQVVGLMEKLLQYLAVESQSSGLRKGGSFQLLSTFLSIVFVNKENLMDKIVRSFKVHVQIEEAKQEKKNDNAGWLSKGSTTNTKAGKIINYWCFNPGFGMEQLLNQNVRSVILTSGTLAPLKPLIAELAIPIKQSLENPHIVSHDQVYVKIIGSGPDGEELKSNYANRDNPKYIHSLGQTVLNISRVVPDGLLVFFPSYPMLNQCVNSWQASGLWHNLSSSKPIFVEPRTKESFNSTMEEFYQSIRDSKGACFLAVCRGKVSEGLDFADRNGRAVIITGLPFPPLKDPKVILKKKYLDGNRTKENELLSGDEWYRLDATRAVNQAIGRVIRHRNDYGAILLCDVRFQQQSQVTQLSKWIKPYLGDSPKCSRFGPINRELREFFKKAEKTIPSGKERKIENIMNTRVEQTEETVRSPYFNESQQQRKLKSKINAFDVERTNAVENWTPAEYIKAAGKPGGSKVPVASDLLSRLDEAYNTSMKSTAVDNVNEVKIHKRVCLSPPANDYSPFQSDFTKKKRFKLVNINPMCATSSIQPSGSNSTLTNGSSKEAPEDRVEFLRVLRGALTATDFNDFKSSLTAYKSESNFDKLMEFLLRVLGTPELRFMLLGMRRYLKLEHKAKFDEMMA